MISSSVVGVLDLVTHRLQKGQRAGEIGTVVAVEGLSIALRGFYPKLRVGQGVSIRSHNRARIEAEVIRVVEDTAWVLPHGRSRGLSVGLEAESQEQRVLRVSDGWLGRVVDPFGNPLDAKGFLPRGTFARPLQSIPLPPGLRQKLGAQVSLGVRVLDTFTTIREGQRLGLFAASGVGKSTLLAMLARNREFDVTVLGLVGERGRELREFVEDDLGPTGMARSVVVCATSDSPPLTRREAAYASFTIAEHFRDEGKRVLLLLDSVTRFALACREIGLSTGEAPTTRGFPPSVFGELPLLLERAGPGLEGSGSITAVITVLVDGDNHDEPISDAVRGILDGHVVLDRRLAERGQYPPVDVARSLSRTVPGCLTSQQAYTVTRARKLLALHAEVSDLILLGGYRKGSDAAIDEAVQLAPRINACLQQSRTEMSSIDTAFRDLASAIADAPQ